MAAKDNSQNRPSPFKKKKKKKEDENKSSFMSYFGF